MSTAGEAASLFGSAESATDPFSAVLSNDTGDAAGQASSDSVSQLFTSEDGGASSSTYDAWDNTSSAGQDYNYYTEPAQEHVGTTSAYQSAPAQADYYGNYGQPAYSAYGHPYAASVGTNNVYASAHTDAQQMNDPYAPTHAHTMPTTPSYAPSSSVYTPSVPATGSTYTKPSESAYDPYRPAPVSPAAPQFPAVPAAPQVYDPYNPGAQYASYAPTSQSMLLHAPNATLQPPKSPSIPAPSAASAPPSSAAPYRPKVLNAYDPPIPPPKRHTHTAAHVRSPPALQQPLSPPPRVLSPPKRQPLSSPAPPNGLYNPPAGLSTWHNGTSSAPPPSGQPSFSHPPAFGAGSSTNDSYAPQRNTSPHFPESSYPSYGTETHVSLHDWAPPPQVQNDPRQQSAGTMQPPPLPSPSHSPLAVLSARGRAASPSNITGAISSMSTEYSVSQEARATSPPRQATSVASVYNSYSPAHHEEAALASNDSNSHSPPPHDSYAPSRLSSMDAPVQQSAEGFHGMDLGATPSLQARGDGQKMQHSPPPVVAAERARSPGTSSIHSWTSVSSLEVPVKAPISPPPRAPSQASPPPTVKRTSSPLVNRTASPSSSSVRSFNGSYSSFADPYAPRRDSIAQDYSPQVPANGSAYAPPTQGPYAPPGHSRHPSDKSNYSSYSITLPNNGASSRRSTLSRDASMNYINELTVPAQTMYAPSPSLLGTNDPLGRTSVRVPVISFGFGGKVVTCFHGSSASPGGFDVALSSRGSTDVKISTLHTIVPASALDSSTAVYPGPLFADPGAPTTTIVRPTAATQTKMKKASVVKYLDERAEEISRGLGYLHLASPEGRKSEAKLTLIRLLKIMVQNDGRISGTPEIDAAVRFALVPGIATSSSATVESAALPSALDLRTPFSEAAGFAGSLPNVNESAIHTARSLDLDKLQELLVRGDRRGAYQYASEQKLWAHAMVIASSIDKEAWKDVVKEFVRADLSSNVTQFGEDESSPGSGREPLRVAYSHYAGQGPASVQELLPPKPLAHSVSSLQIPPPSVNPSPISPSFGSSVEPMTLPFGVLSRWAETAAMIMSHPMSSDSSATLSALGDQLAANQWYEAAHVCYMLSPQTAPMGGLGSGSRFVLVGSPGPQPSATFLRDSDPIIFTEIVEFALSLATPAKGQEVFTGVVHLQAFRFVHAMALAEIGNVQLAKRYCEAISQCLSKSSPYVHPAFVAQLEGLLGRLVAGPQNEKTSLWIGSNPPNLSKVGGWIGNRLAEFVAGEGAEAPKPEITHELPAQSAPSGPFAHYSNISSATNSVVSSPQQSRIDLRETAGTPPLRTGSAIGERYPVQPSYMAPNRASSAMGYPVSTSRTASPIQRVASANAARNGDYSAYGSYGQVPNGYGSARSSLDVPRPETQPGATLGVSDSGPYSGGWYGTQDGDAPTPTASSFSHDNESSASQFVSLMDDQPNSYTPMASHHSSSFERQSSQQSFDDEEDDLGLGNSSSSRAKRMTEAAKEGDSPTQEPKEGPKNAEEPQKPELRSAASGSWISRLWKRDSTPAPVRANLGEEKTFYYDEKLKRWVNKHAATEEAKPAPPLPPPRAQTTSPSRTNATFSSGPTPPPPPPTRPATAGAIDLGGQLPPRKGPPPRVRSNLVPTDSDSSAPPTPLSASPLSDGPPMGTGRAKAKRAVRSRYVDVFQQQAES